MKCRAMPYLNRSVLFILFSLIAPILNAQSLERTSFADLFAINLPPQLDSSTNVNRLSLDECHLLIEKMYIVDQRSRDSLVRYQTDKTKYQYFSHLTFINDAANQIILMKILKRYGWPCDNDSRRLSTKAWFIAWHARSNFELLSQFHSYMIKVNTPSCINSTQLGEIEERLARAKSVRSR